MANTSLHVISALRAGIPPEYGVERYSVGRKEILHTFRADVANVASGASALRYISADIGYGKTLLRLLRQEAFDRDFVVAEVELSAGRCPLYSLLDVYRNVVLALRTRDSPTEPAMEAVLDRWLKFQTTTSESVRKEALGRLHSRFQAALVSYLMATNYLVPSPTQRHVVLRWLLGEQINATERRRYALFENITDDTALWMLDDMSDLFRDVGYGGVCILFDEAESLVSFTRSAERQRALENLQRIVRAADETKGCYFVYATTPSFIDAYGSDPAFHPHGDGTVLQLDPISRQEAADLVGQICGIYTDAYGWEIPADALDAVKSQAQSSSLDRVSDLIRTTIAALDAVRERG